LIDYSIANKIEIFEAGAQGEHKFLRGFVAVPTYSSHFIINREANEAIKKYLINERNYTTRLINDYNRISPLKYLHEQI
jgi:predicted N-acyltransferase